MFSNSSRLDSWLWAVIVAVNCWPSTTGSAPSVPTETVVFWAEIAAVISAGVSWYSASDSGSSQTRSA